MVGIVEVFASFVFYGGVVNQINCCNRCKRNKLSRFVIQIIKLNRAQYVTLKLAQEGLIYKFFIELKIVVRKYKTQDLALF